MALAFLILIQAAASAPAERAPLAVPPRCAAQRPAGDEIVVCAQREKSPYRIQQPPARQSEIPKAEVQLAAGVSASAETEQAMIGGFPSNRMVLRLKIKF